MQFKYRGETRIARISTNVSNPMSGGKLSIRSAMVNGNGIAPQGPDQSVISREFAVIRVSSTAWLRVKARLNFHLAEVAGAGRVNVSHAEVQRDDVLSGSLARWELILLPPCFSFKQVAEPEQNGAILAIFASQTIGEQVHGCSLLTAAAGQYGNLSLLRRQA